MAGAAAQPSHLWFSMAASPNNSHYCPWAGYLANQPFRRGVSRVRFQGDTISGMASPRVG
jgi:hypothetical protein